jgi:hypothetical protein
MIEALKIFAVFFVPLVLATIGQHLILRSGRE